MAAFNLEDFVANPTLGHFDHRKNYLCEITANYDIFVLSSLVKTELKAVILNELTEKVIVTSQDGFVTGAVAVHK